jgi:hypothetical protein
MGFFEAVIRALVVPFLVFLAAFAAGQELSQMTAHRKPASPRK